MYVREIKVRSVLTKSKIPSVDYSLNPYAGCFFGCTYCFADFMRRFYNERREWGEWVYVKVNAPDVLKREVIRKSPGVVSMSIVTDPYLPLELRYNISHSCLEILKDTNFHVSILTKSVLVKRDLDLISSMEKVDLGMSIAFREDDPFQKVFELRVKSPEERFKVLEIFSYRGIDTWVFFNPIIPGVNDDDETIEWIFKRSHDVGINSILADLLTPYPSVVRKLIPKLEGRSRKTLGFFVQNTSWRTNYMLALKSRLTSSGARYGIKVETFF